MSGKLDRITLLNTFVRIAETGSISAAARDLGLSQPSASRQLFELERRFKTQLIRRNTHSLALTDSGTELLFDSRQLIDSWESLEEKYLSEKKTVKGNLKVVAPIALGQEHLTRIACEFQLQYPNVSLTWELLDETIKFAEVGCDCWIKVGPVPDETLIVRPLVSIERFLVASKEFLNHYGLIKSPEASAELPFIALSPFEWSKVTLSHNNKRDVTIEPMLRMKTNNIFALKEATLKGVGMSIMPKWFVSSELKNGELVDLLHGWKAPFLTVHLAYLPSRHQPLRLRTFIDFLTKEVPLIEGLNSV
ncbi:LysR family transcriptional regulator [Marinicella sp. W31]|uniref:LysR family transcriptional regulator n=1 Tax=Marinicella sp. W31 TaxID=3023713 RepID=UPI0037576706